MLKTFGLSLLFVVASVLAAPQTNQGTSTASSASTNHDRTVYFVVSASNLNGDVADTDGSADPFVKVYLGSEPSVASQNGTESELTPLGVSETVSENNSPQWNTVFKVDHFPRTKQLLYFEVRDHDPVNPDDVIGDAYIKLDEFVTTGKHTQVLEKAKSGAITLTRTTPVYFDLLLRNVPAKDWWGGLSDPYVKCYFRVGQEGTDFKFHTTDVIDDSETASYERVPFEQYQRGTNQIFHFRVKDSDQLSGDDDLGEAMLNVDTFLDGRAPVNFNLPEGLRLQVTRSRGTY